LWYLVPDENHNNDGRHTSYLHRDQAGFERCDPELYGALRDTLAQRRAVAEIEQRNVLPPGTKFHTTPLQFERHESLRTREVKRQAWLDSALHVASGADLVFVDPDNGLECAVGRFTKNGPKYVYYSDIDALCRLESTLVIYHHLSRQGSATEQVKRRANALRERIPPGYALSALRFRRGSARTYFVALAPPHQRRLSQRMDAFLAGGWSQHFTREQL
jgi:hypothetical protein